MIKLAYALKNLLLITKLNIYTIVLLTSPKPKTRLTTARKINYNQNFTLYYVSSITKIENQKRKMAHFGVSYTLTPPIGHQRLTFNTHCIVCVCDLSMQKLKQRERVLYVRELRHKHK
jgi:hypothetical protein